MLISSLLLSYSMYSSRVRVLVVLDTNNNPFMFSTRVLSSSLMRVCVCLVCTRLHLSLSWCLSSVCRLIAVYCICKIDHVVDIELEVCVGLGDVTLRRRNGSKSVLVC